MAELQRRIENLESRLQLLNEGVEALGNHRSKDGAPGQTATVSVGPVHEGPFPAVRNIGTAHEAVFEFIIPRGRQGEQGPVCTCSAVQVVAVKEPPKKRQRKKNVGEVI